MDNPFKNIIQNEQVPEILREKVMNDINLIKISLDMADLLLVQYPSTIIELLASTTKNIKKHDDSSN